MMMQSGGQNSWSGTKEGGRFWEECRCRSPGSSDNSDKHADSSSSLARNTQVVVKAGSSRLLSCEYCVVYVYERCGGSTKTPPNRNADRWELLDGVKLSHGRVEYAASRSRKKLSSVLVLVVGEMAGARRFRTSANKPSESSRRSSSLLSLRPMGSMHAIGAMAPMANVDALDNIGSSFVARLWDDELLGPTEEPTNEQADGGVGVMSLCRDHQENQSVDGRESWIWGFLAPYGRLRNLNACLRAFRSE